MRHERTPRGAGVWVVMAALFALIGGFASASVAAAQGGSAQEAVMDVVERFNLSTIDATAMRDPTVMREFTTNEFYQEMALDMRADWAAGVAAIDLVDLEWGSVAVNGPTATAYTVETWAIQLADGSGGELPPQINFYRLMLQDGQWKVDANEHPGSIFQ